jgi:uncharacterized protein with ACT and thioredoxin-like domain
VAEAYAVPLTIATENRTGMLAEIAAVVAEVGSNIVHVEARTADEHGTIELVVEIPDMKHLERVLNSLRRIDGVFEVTRSTRTVNQARHDNYGKIERQAIQTSSHSGNWPLFLGIRAGNLLSFLGKSR